MGRGATPSPARLVERVERLGRASASERPLRVALVDELRRAIGFDWYAWLLTDPETEVGVSPLADTPSLADLPRLIRSKYLTSLNRWTGLDGPAVGLHTATGGALDHSPLWRDVLAGYGVVDVASLVLRDAHGCWGWLDLWRAGPAPPFDDTELAALTAVAGPTTSAVRRALARTFDEVQAAAAVPGPAVLLLSPNLEVKGQTGETDEYLRMLVPPDVDRRPIPAGAYNVGAQLLAVEAGVDDHVPAARTHLGGGTWLTLRAARVDADGSPGDRDIAVTIERATPADRGALFQRCHALSPRERELVALLAGGADTHTIAREMFVSEHTVQDHLKSIFRKTGAPNRRVLVSRLLGTWAGQPE